MLSRPRTLPTSFSPTLEPAPGDRFDSSSGTYPVSGKRGGNTETLEAVAFTPRTDAQAKILSGDRFIKGTKRINLGIYSDDDGVSCIPLPGGQGSTERIPDVDQCFQMTTATLAGEGVTLTAGTA